MAVFFLCTPAINAWYLVWLLAFAAVYPSRWAWTASVTFCLSYITGVTVDDGSLALYQQPLWARLIEYGAIALALVFDLRAGLRQHIEKRTTCTTQIPIDTQKKRRALSLSFGKN